MQSLRADILNAYGRLKYSEMDYYPFYYDRILYSSLYEAWQTTSLRKEVLIGYQAEQNIFVKMMVNNVEYHNDPELSRILNLYGARSLTTPKERYSDPDINTRLRLITLQRLETDKALDDERRKNNILNDQLIDLQKDCGRYHAELRAFRSIKKSTDTQTAVKNFRDSDTTYERLVVSNISTQTSHHKGHDFSIQVNPATTHADTQTLTKEVISTISQTLTKINSEFSTQTEILQIDQNLQTEHINKTYISSEIQTDKKFTEEALIQTEEPSSLREKRTSVNIETQTNSAIYAQVAIQTEEPQKRPINRFSSNSPKRSRGDFAAQVNMTTSPGRAAETQTEASKKTLTKNSSTQMEVSYNNQLIQTNTTTMKDAQTEYIMELTGTTIRGIAPKRYITQISA